FSLLVLPPPLSTLFPYTTLFRSELFLDRAEHAEQAQELGVRHPREALGFVHARDPEIIVREGAERGDELGLVAEMFLDDGGWGRSEEHTSELQSQSNLVCRLLLE